MHSRIGDHRITLVLPRTTDGRPILSRDDLNRLDPPRWGGGRLRYYCPIHGGSHQRSLSVDARTGLYYCHSCKAGGRLRDDWDDEGTTRPSGRRGGPRPAAAAGDDHTRQLATLLRANADRGATLARPIPDHARSFIDRLDALREALADRRCPGAAYLRRRGLDPLLAARLGAGYAAPGTWPGEAAWGPGRIVYPLHDARTGRVVSALGRACVDDTTLPTRGRAGKAQLKLRDCPAGVWPGGQAARARREGQPLVLVEGPADALALLTLEDAPPIVALAGTHSPLTLDVLRSLVGLVIAFDEDDAGRAAARRLAADLDLLGIPHHAPPSGWLGADATDPADLAAASHRARLLERVSGGDRPSVSPEERTYRGLVAPLAAAARQLQSPAHARIVVDRRAPRAVLSASPS